MVVYYQPLLVLLSIVVAIIGSLTSLAVTSASRIVDDDESWEAGFALANGGLIMGTTIWSMHFIAMMAVKFGVLINYNIVETILSIVIAMSVTAMGLFIVNNRRLGYFSIPGAGVLMGLGIASMHYLGMGAIRGCGLAYDPTLVAASIAIAVAASIAALWFAFYKRSVVATLAGGSCKDWPLPRCTTPPWPPPISFLSTHLLISQLLYLPRTCWPSRSRVRSL
jgi:NO-binding membrane sensor protein with MHYT domain